MHFEFYLESPKKSLIFVYKKLLKVLSLKHPELQIMVACKM